MPGLTPARLFPRNPSGPVQAGPRRERQAPEHAVSAPTAQTSSAPPKSTQIPFPSTSRRSILKSVPEVTLSMSSLQMLKSVKKVSYIILQAHSNPLPTLFLKILPQTSP